MRKQSRAVVALGIVIIVVACVNFKGKNQDISILGFDSKQWKEDSISCSGYRAKVVDKLIEGKKVIQNKSKEDIKTFLGFPNVVEFGYYRYFIEKGVQCLGYVNKNGYDSLETVSLVIDFDDKNKVKDVGKIVP